MTDRAAEIREYLGERVRRIRTLWAAEQPDVAEHPSWTTPWVALDERDREADRRIGEALFRAGWEAREIAARAEAGPPDGDLNWTYRS